MGLETLALNSAYRTKMDERHRIPFPSNWRDEIDQQISSIDYYLLLKLQQPASSGSKYFRIEPIAMEEYDKQAKQMNSKAEEDQERIQFFKQYRAKLDEQGRINLTRFLAELVGFKTKKEYTFIGRGNYCILQNLDEKGLIDLMLKEEQPK